MNKKVLTLCAGFVLAGGMLSSLSAVNLKEAANTGKYYKMVEGAFGILVIQNGLQITQVTGFWT